MKSILLYLFSLSSVISKKILIAILQVKNQNEEILKHLKENSDAKSKLAALQTCQFHYTLKTIIIF